MPTPPTRNTEARIRRTIRAAMDAGFCVGSVEVATNGIPFALPLVSVLLISLVPMSV